MSEQHHVVTKEGKVKLNKVDNAIERMDQEQIEDILASFEEFKAYLSKRVDLAKKIGLNEEQLALSAEKIGDYLSNHVEPQNREEKLLQELWRAGNKEERHMLAHMLVKLVD